MVVSLLEQSHDLNPQFNVATRVYLLQRQAEVMSRVDAELGQAWAQELLALATQTKGDLRSMAENSAMTILVQLNPDRALLWLHSLSKEEPQADFTPSLPNRKLVQRVFQVLVERDGERAIPLIEGEAARMGADGPYPYGPLGYAAMQSVLKEWATNHQHAVEVVQKVFDRALERYSQGPRTYADDFEFATMLQPIAGGLPNESVQPALRLLVKNLLTTDTSKYRFEAGVYTADGKAAKADNAIDAALLYFGGLIIRIDPELAKQLESTRPELQAGLQYAQDGRERSSFFRTSGQPLNGRPPDPNPENGADALRLATVDTDAAVAKAEALPASDRRADTILSIAREIADKQPDRAQELIAQVERSNEAGIPELQLDVISAKASIASAKDKKDETRELLQQGFGLATPIILELQKSGDVFFVPGLGRLVQTGMQNDQDSTIPFVQTLPASGLKANLLLVIAMDLTMLPRGPKNSQQAPRPEKSNP
jgi:hypothetical protein